MNVGAAPLGHGSPSRGVIASLSLYQWPRRSLCGQKSLCTVSKRVSGCLEPKIICLMTYCIETTSKATRRPLPLFHERSRLMLFLPPTRTSTITSIFFKKSFAKWLELFLEVAKSELGVRDTPRHTWANANIFCLMVFACQRLIYKRCHGDYQCINRSQLPLLGKFDSETTHRRTTHRWTTDYRDHSSMETTHRRTSHRRTSHRRDNSSTDISSTG